MPCVVRRESCVVRRASCVQHRLPFSSSNLTFTKQFNKFGIQRNLIGTNVLSNALNGVLGSLLVAVIDVTDGAVL